MIVSMDYSEMPELLRDRPRLGDVVTLANGMQGILLSTPQEGVAEVAIDHQRLISTDTETRPDHNPRAARDETIVMASDVVNRGRFDWPRSNAIFALALEQLGCSPPEEMRHRIINVPTGNGDFAMEFSTDAVHVAVHVSPTLDGNFRCRLTAMNVVIPKGQEQSEAVRGMLSGGYQQGRGLGMLSNGGGAVSPGRDEQGRPLRYWPDSVGRQLNRPEPIAPEPPAQPAEPTAPAERFVDI